MRIHTIGHSTRSQEALIGLLHENGVGLLVDVRAYPRSRRNPQFNAEVVEAALADAGIGYRHMKALGGRRGPRPGGASADNAAWRVPAFRSYADYAMTDEFRAAIEELRGLARAQPAAVMCAEAHWSQCHRRIIADHLLTAGDEVIHILGPGEAEPARLSAWAEPLPGGGLRYPAPQGELF